MWLSERNSGPLRRAACAAGVVLGLGACGFSPVYGPKGSGAELAGAVTISAPSDEVEFDLARSLEDRFGPPIESRYTLNTDLSTRSQRVSITATQDTNRFNLVGRVDWSLTENATGAILADGVAEGFSSYSATGTTVATRAAQRDAYKRLTVILADRIAIDLNSRDFAAEEQQPAISTAPAT